MEQRISRAVGKREDRLLKIPVADPEIKTTRLLNLLELGQQPVKQNEVFKSIAWEPEESPLLNNLQEISLDKLKGSLCDPQKLEPVPRRH